MKWYRSIRRVLSNARNRAKSTEDVFTDVYSANKWGGQKGEYCSGSGSTNRNIVDPYVETIVRFADLKGFQNLRFIDLGCGDFRVGNRLRALSRSYVGVDIVKSMVESHCLNYADEKTNFLHLDIIKDELPAGDICFIRQVFQHLSNEQIQKILLKLEKYRWIFITEHYPLPSNFTAPNIDKVHGADVRLYRGSGVYLNLPPFNVSADLLKVVLCVEEFGNEGIQNGEIKTILYEPLRKK